LARLFFCFLKDNYLIPARVRINRPLQAPGKKVNWEGNLTIYPTEIPKEVCKKRSIFIIITTPIITRHTANNQMTNNKYFDKKLQSIYAKEHYMATYKKITFTEEYLLEWKTASSGLLGEESMLRSKGGILAK